MCNILIAGIYLLASTGIFIGMIADDDPFYSQQPIILIFTTYNFICALFIAFDLIYIVGFTAVILMTTIVYEKIITFRYYQLTGTQRGL